MPSVAEWMRGCGLPRLDAQLLLGAVLGLGRAGLLAHPEREIDAAALARLDRLAARARAGEPLAYLLGRREFWGLDFAVSPDVLVPRPDTETLVQAALDVLPPSGEVGRPVLDLGTGSGAVAIALAHARPDIAVWASDLSAAALQVAQNNAARLLPADRPGGPLRWLQSDWFAALPEGARFAAIVSNPPYIAAGDPHLPALRHEPALALVGRQPSADGLSDIRRIVAAAPRWLATGGWLLLEHGYDQAAAVRALLQAAGFAQVNSWRDLAGIERVSGGRHPGRASGGGGA